MYTGLMRLVGLLLFSCLLLPAQQACIEGFIVNDLTGEPIEGAHIRLTMLFDGPLDTYGAMSDHGGRFSITSVHPGAYLQSVDRTGFVEMLTKEKPVPFARLILKPDQHLTGYKITLTPRAVIRGRVVNQEGDPVEGVEVQAEPTSKDVSPFGSGNLADDHGEFLLGGVPGSYYVKAQPSREKRPLELRSDGTSDVIYSVTYYPNSASKDHASRVESRAGREVAGIEIRLSAAPQQPTLTIRGVVTGRPDDGSTTVGIVMESGESPKKLD
jgi:Carboxypeptidase regulatory-like domain